MKINNLPGEMGFKALFPNECGWELSKKYFFTQEEVTQQYPLTTNKWPVEVWENGTVYIPSKEELE